MERRTSNNNLVLGIQSVYELNINAAVDASSTEVYLQPRGEVYSARRGCQRMRDNASHTTDAVESFHAAP